MRQMAIFEDDASEDGHPCEAALEFRRAAIRWGVAEEVPADELDLAVSYAWIGKAVSRTASAPGWLAIGVDPNTWHMVRAMAADLQARSAALASAKQSAAGPGLGRSLESIRRSPGFLSACRAVEASEATGRGEWLRRAAAQLPGGRVACPVEGGAEIVPLQQFRERRGRSA